MSEKIARSWMSHPRPQMRREKYMILKDGWELNAQPIHVPYPPQAQLSGYKGELGDKLEYECRFIIPEAWKGGRILLHFDAVDQIAEVCIGGNVVGRHEGGYLPFAFDVTDYVTRDDVSCLKLTVWDELSQDYPYGKQTKKRMECGTRRSTECIHMIGRFVNRIKNVCRRWLKNWGIKIILRKFEKVGFF